MSLIKLARFAFTTALGSCALAPQVVAGQCNASQHELSQLREKLSTAVMLESKGQFDGAARLLEAVRATGCWDTQHAIFLGEVYISAGRYAEALPHLEEARTDEFADIRAMRQLAEAHFRLGNHQQAIQALDSAIEAMEKQQQMMQIPSDGLIADPTRAELYAQRSDIQLAQGKREAAIEDLRKATKFDPFNPVLKQRLTQVLNGSH